MTFIALFRKEVYAYFVSPLFYIAAAVFFALSGFFFYTQLIYFVQYGYGLNILANFWFAYVARSAVFDLVGAAVGDAAAHHATNSRGEETRYH